MPLLHASLLSLLLAAPAPSPRVSPKPVSPPASRFSAPEVRVQGYRVVVEKLTQARNFSTDFAGNGQPSGGKTTRRQMVVVSLAVHPSNVSLLPHIAGLGTRAVAYSPSDAALPFRAYPVEDPGPLRSGTWRTQVVAEELDVGITQINRLQGELIVYPKARRVTLEFPLPSNTPQTRTVDGFRAVLRSFK
ncbi:MAG TPA: hypothetical protein VK689_13530, partial [Armatimonadota bacterium]|nr:hypothetical protein [Armatimonadota bacterium]